MLSGPENNLQRYHQELAQHNTNNLIFFFLPSLPSTTDDVEKSLELLDKVLSEFEEEQEVIHAPVEPDSPSQGHQSEDDGYMSMNGRR